MIPFEFWLIWIFSNFFYIKSDLIVKQWKHEHSILNLFFLISQEILQLRSLSYYCGHHSMRSSFPVNISCFYQKSKCWNWMWNIRHQMFFVNYQIFILNYFLSEIFSNWNFSKVQFSIKYPISFSFSYSFDEEKRQ